MSTGGWRARRFRSANTTRNWAISTSTAIFGRPGRGDLPVSVRQARCAADVRPRRQAVPDQHLWRQLHELRAGQRRRDLAGVAGGTPRRAGSQLRHRRLFGLSGVSADAARGTAGAGRIHHLQHLRRRPRAQSARLAAIQVRRQSQEPKSHRAAREGRPRSGPDHRSSQSVPHAAVGVRSVRSGAGVRDVPRRFLSAQPPAAGRAAGPGESRFPPPTTTTSG